MAAVVFHFFRFLHILYGTVLVTIFLFVSHLKKIKKKLSKKLPKEIKKFVKKLSKN